ncbi:TniQ family protein [Gordonia sp. CPCC 206044]
MDHVNPAALLGAPVSRVRARALPLRVEPVYGEALDSFVEAYARRYHVTPAEFYRHIGCSNPSVREVVKAPSLAVLEAIAVASELPVGVVRAMTLDSLPSGWAARQAPLSSVSSAYRRDRRYFWMAAGGSRFCPACLADTDGRWLLRWRLRWSFVCVKHRCLLVDTCASCGVVPRRSPHLGSLAGRQCLGRPPDGVENGVCGARFASMRAIYLCQGHCVLDAQRRIDELIASEVGNSIRLSGGVRGTPDPLLSDIARLVRHIITYGRLGSPARCGVFADTIREHRAENPDYRCSAHTSIPTMCFAGAVVLALEILDHSDIDRAAHMLGEILPVPTIRGRSTDLQIEMSVWARRSGQIAALWDRLREQRGN